MEYQTFNSEMNSDKKPCWDIFNSILHKGRGASMPPLYFLLKFLRDWLFEAEMSSLFIKVSIDQLQKDLAIIFFWKQVFRLYPECDPWKFWKNWIFYNLYFQIGVSLSYQFAFTLFLFVLLVLHCLFEVRKIVLYFTDTPHFWVWLIRIYIIKHDDVVNKFQRQQLIYKIELAANQVSSSYHLLYMGRVGRSGCKYVPE